MRLFVALELPEATRAAALRLVEGLAVGRLVAQENLHLTLAFLGEVARAELGVLDEVLGQLRHPKFELEFQDLVALGGRQARVLALAARGPEALQVRMVSALRGAGFELPRRRFRAHVTLVRLPRRMGAVREQQVARFLGEAAGAAGDIAPVHIDSFALFASQLHPEGAVYERLARYPLG